MTRFTRYRRLETFFQMTVMITCPEGQNARALAPGQERREEGQRCTTDPLLKNGDDPVHRDRDNLGHVKADRDCGVYQETRREQRSPRLWSVRKIRISRHLGVFRMAPHKSCGCPLKKSADEPNCGRQHETSDAQCEEAINKNVIQVLQPVLTMRLWHATSEEQRMPLLTQFEM